VVRLVKTFLKEPFFHFLALGVLIFFVYGMLVPDTQRQDGNVIRVSADRIEQLKAAFKGARGREPAKNELDGLVVDYLKQEVLYRSALELGLDRNDQVIRNRLRSKMEFLADSGAKLLDPGDEELATYMSARPDIYSKPPRFTFRQIFLGANPSAQEVETVTLAARQAGLGPEIENLGQSIMLPGRLSNVAPLELDARFGGVFAKGVAKLTTGQWSGPAKSGFGWHLVYIEEMVPGSLLDLSDAREPVLRDWQVERGIEIRNAQYKQLRARYTVEFADGEAR